MKKINKNDIKKVQRIINKYIKNKYIAITLLALLALGSFYFNEVHLSNKETALDVNITYKHAKCVDGDTFKLDKRTVRMLAIDTPETVKPNTPVQAFGPEASKLTCNLLSKANNISLKQDKGNTHDQYDRTLAWVYADDVFIQEELLKKGYAKIKFVDNKTIDQSILKKLKKAENYAKSNKLGIWSLNNQ